MFVSFSSFLALYLSHHLNASSYDLLISAPTVPPTFPAHCFHLRVNILFYIPTLLLTLSLSYNLVIFVPRRPPASMFILKIKLSFEFELFVPPLWISLYMLGFCYHFIYSRVPPSSPIMSSILFQLLVPPLSPFFNIVRHYILSVPVSLPLMTVMILIKSYNHETSARFTKLRKSPFWLFFSVSSSSRLSLFSFLIYPNHMAFLPPSEPGSCKFSFIFLFRLPSPRDILAVHCGFQALLSVDEMHPPPSNIFTFLHSLSCSILSTFCASLITMWSASLRVVCSWMSSMTKVHDMYSFVIRYDHLNFDRYILSRLGSTPKLLCIHHLDYGSRIFSTLKQRLIHNLYFLS